MPTKWLDVALRRQKQDAPNGKSSVTPVPGIQTSQQGSSADKTYANLSGKNLAKSQGDLQPLEDIYRAAGIMNPRMGYSISKVVEMLNNDHIRGLSSDTKRAAVLMTLDAAGISIDEVLRDARQRQAALDAYEAVQRKHFEEYWARKGEINAEIQVTMELVTAQSLDRIKRNLDEVVLEKTAFARWQTMKQQELERMSEAVGLCLKPSSPEPSGGSLMVTRGVGPTVKPS